MNRRAALVAVVGSTAAAAGLGLALRRTPVVDEMAAIWALTLEQPDGRVLAFAELRGRPLLLNFWAPWCPPCVVEMPLLDRFHVEQRSRGWTVVGVAVDRADPVREFLQRQPMSFPIVLAGAGGLDLGRQLGNSTGGLPFSIALRANGAVLGRRLGQLDEPQLQSWANLSA